MSRTVLPSPHIRTPTTIGLNSRQHTQVIWHRITGCPPTQINDHEGQLFQYYGPQTLGTLFCVSLLGHKNTSLQYPPPLSEFLVIHPEWEICETRHWCLMGQAGSQFSVLGHHKRIWKNFFLQASQFLPFQKHVHGPNMDHMAPMDPLYAVHSHAGARTMVMVVYRGLGLG